jgi:hypothetical protein
MRLDGAWNAARRCARGARTPVSEDGSETEAVELQGARGTGVRGIALRGPRAHTRRGAPADGERNARIGIRRVAPGFGRRRLRVIYEVDRAVRIGRTAMVVGRDRNARFVVTREALHQAAVSRRRCLRQKQQQRRTRGDAAADAKRCTADFEKEESHHFTLSMCREA